MIYAIAVYVTFMFGAFIAVAQVLLVRIELWAAKEASMIRRITGVLSKSGLIALQFLGMLIAMTYNVGIFCALCAGGGKLSCHQPVLSN